MAKGVLSPSLLQESFLDFIGFDPLGPGVDGTVDTIIGGYFCPIEDSYDGGAHDISERLLNFDTVVHKVLNRKCRAASANCVTRLQVYALQFVDFIRVISKCLVLKYAVFVRK